MNFKYDFNFKQACSKFAIQTLALLLLILAFSAISIHAQQTENEKAVWKLEHNYWEYVQAADLVNYRSLWHENFVGWPSMSSQPARKDHITDWITSRTAEGEKVQWFTLQPAASQATENLVVTHYWITSRWVDKAGHGEPSTSRITHTWIKTPAGWQIISGMSSTVPAK